MANKIQFKRGIKTSLPALAPGEPGYCTDTKELFIGNESGGNTKFIRAGELIFNVKDYGAKGDGVTNDRDAIQAAIDATPAGGVLRIPETANGYYLKNTSPSDTQLLLITKPIRFVGSGLYSKLLIDSTVPNTCDVIRVSPSTSYGKDLAGIEGIHIEPVSGTPARHGIHIDVTNTGQYIARYTIQRNVIKQLGGWGIKLTNPTNLDGFFASCIEKNLIYGGMSFQRLGDSIDICKNTITGSNVGVEISGIDGACQVTIEKNNITTAGGAIKINSHDQVKIIKNQIEQVNAYTGDTVNVNASIYLGTVPHAEVIGNNITAHGNVAHNIRAATSYRATIDRNTMRKGTAEIIRVDSGSNKTDIGYNNFYIDTNETEIAPSILNNGIGTMGIENPLTLINGYTADEAVNFGTPSVIKDSNGIVHFKGKLVPGTRTAGTTITILPVGFRPTKACNVNVGYWNFTTSKTEIMTLIIDAAGSVVVANTLDTARIDLDGITFKASY